MSYISAIFDRLNMQQMRSYLLHGTSYNAVSDKSYKERLDEASETVTEFIEANFSDLEENTKASNIVYQYASVNKNVYMEIGLQCGAMLLLQLLTPPPKE